MVPNIAFLAVSLFKRELQGEMLGQHIDLLDHDARFDRIIVALGDTLFAHNIDRRIGSLATRRIQARALGSRWLKDNAPYLLDTKKPLALLRHDVQIDRPDFPLAQARLGFLFRSGVFADALAADVAEFVERQAAGDREEAEKASRTYILEELTADVLTSRFAPFSHIYPGKPLRSYIVMAEHAEAVPAALRGLEHCAFLRTRVQHRRVRFARDVMQAAIVVDASKGNSGDPLSAAGL